MKEFAQENKTQSERKYWLHRISHEWEISYVLLDEKGYLSLGWSKFSKSGILDAARKSDDDFENVYRKEIKDKNKSRWNMWYFANFKVGDYVVVPRYNGEFSVCEVLEIAKPIGEIQNEFDEFTDKKSHRITWDKNIDLLRIEGSDDSVDLGFVVKVKILRTEKRSEYADSALNSRMKMRQTNGDISDLGNNIVEVTKAEAPINFYENAIEAGAKVLLDRIVKDLNPSKFELLVKSYLDKIGADYSYIPSRNETGKTNHADADVIAVFEKLKLTVQVQVKHHTDETSQWSVEQIKEYEKQLKDKTSELYHEREDNYTIIPWVISSCDFSNEAIKKAYEENVRLITGTEFSRMLMDAGLANIDKDIQANAK